MDAECKRRTNPRKCFKYYKILVEEGKDVEEIFKLEREQKKIENTVKKIGDGLKEVKTNLRFFGLS